MAIARDIVSSLNATKHNELAMRDTREPAYPADDIYGIVSREYRFPYDIREVIARIVDASEFQEFKKLYGSTLVCGFAHIDGYPVGIVANNGILFMESAQKLREYGRIEIGDCANVNTSFPGFITLAAGSGLAVRQEGA